MPGNLFMKKPSVRPNIPPRTSDNHKRKLHPNPESAINELLKIKICYGGSAKHKANPAIFGLDNHGKTPGDATLCDAHAGFQPKNMSEIPRLLQRGVSSGLIGDVMTTQGIPHIIWTVGDDGWIFEGRLTNPEQTEYHGYPVRPTEPIAEHVYHRFTEWASTSGNRIDQEAAQRCFAMYGFIR